VFRLWTLDSDPNARRLWRLDRIATKFGAQVETNVDFQPGQYWQMTGAPAVANSLGYTFVISLPPGIHALSPLNVAATPVARSESDLAFDSVDVPLDDKVATCNARPNNSENSQLVLRRLVTVKRGSPPPAASGLADTRRSGLAVVVDYPTVTDGDVDIKLISAIDNTGAWLLPRQVAAVDPTTVRASSIKGRQDYAFLINAPSGDADSVRLAFHIVRNSATGPQQTVVLTGLEQAAPTN
jgi:hypothetical protein